MNNFWKYREFAFNSNISVDKVNLIGDQCSKSKFQIQGMVSDEHY